ncbi:MAG: hypothetical protein ACFB51_13005 [Anaerolineae bacterium]
MGYLKIDEKHHAAITSLVAPATPAHRMLDPYAGEGEFLDVAAQAWNVTPYANELDGARAEQCISRFGPKQAVRCDAERVAACLNAVLDERLVEGVRGKQTVVAAKDLDHYVARLTKAGMSVAVARERPAVDAPQPDARPALPPKRSAKQLQQMQQGQLALF